LLLAARGTSATSSTTARITLLSVTVLGTMSNNIVNVPLRAIAEDLAAPLEGTVLLVSAFVLTLAIAMPVVGWLGDRIGMKLTLVLSLAVMLLAQGTAAFAAWPARRSRRW
jgi:MFS family permease